MKRGLTQGAAVIVKTKNFFRCRDSFGLDDRGGLWQGGAAVAALVLLLMCEYVKTLNVRFRTIRTFAPILRGLRPAFGGGWVYISPPNPRSTGRRWSTFSLSRPLSFCPIFFRPSDRYAAKYRQKSVTTTLVA